MRILAADIGTGTQDILLFDSEKEPENSLIMVMPAPTRIIAEKIRKATREGKAIVLTGNIMGGGPSAFAIRAHLKAGFPVYATEQAALTIHDNIEKVKAFGVRIVTEEEANQLTREGSALNIIMEDFDPESVSSALLAFGVYMPENYAVAVQDHGNAPDKSNRVYRFELFKEFIDRGGKLEYFVYTPEEIPEAFTRMKAQADSLLKFVGRPDTRAVFMDTGPAAIFGALTDPAAIQPSLVVNIGNGHTLGALVTENRITALFEHHTSSMNPEKLQDYIIRLADGSLGFDEVFEDGGHGAYVREAPGFEQVRSIMVTGPKREMLEKLSETGVRKEISNKLHFAAPFGSMMLSGCFGLLAGFFEKYPEPSIKFINH
ncbi:pyruvate formate lyase-activating protein [Methanosarcina sp. MSH10X1]|uniref:DUF1786 domain-containing protein n=1 Tax=Methanosarcina sp. MSH10X1 TaxID=2507075 RepID=UPI000FFC24AA|nr:DUF1786 domain-containing protein [Methanosarcina sp. MSH10X1]RXA21268.1 pyruvate formate lyase-activating protein [Methanosarcina sp. MSH10X1]